MLRLPIDENIEWIWKKENEKLKKNIKRWRKLQNFLLLVFRFSFGCGFN